MLKYQTYLFIIVISQGTLVDTDTLSIPDLKGKGNESIKVNLKSILSIFYFFYILPLTFC